MSELNSNIETVLSELSKEILNGDQVAELFNNPEEFPKDLIEKLSLETALKYWNGQINYQDGDCIMNNIYTLWTTNECYLKNHLFPEIAWECYEAFDSGEYYRQNDERSVDPPKKYTRPLIETLLRRQNLIT